MYNRGTFNYGLHFRIRHIIQGIDKDDVHQYQFKIMRLMQEKDRFPRFSLNPASKAIWQDFPHDEELEEWLKQIEIPQKRGRRDINI
jgi:hypothetical protein